MSDQDSIPRIRAYLQQHRDTYDRDALRQQLLADGYSVEEIDRAMAEVYGDERTPAVSSSSLLALPFVMLGTVLLNSGVCFASLRTIGVVPIIIGVMLEIVAAVVLWGKRPPVARGIVWGLIIWLILTVALIMFIMFQLSS